MLSLLNNFFFYKLISDTKVPQNGVNKFVIQIHLNEYKYSENFIKYDEKFQFPTVKMMTQLFIFFNFFKKSIRETFFQCLRLRKKMYKHKLKKN